MPPIDIPVELAAAADPVVVDAIDMDIDISDVEVILVTRLTRLNFEARNYSRYGRFTLSAIKA